MKERELRLALVCYGGVSLAIYMHGITKEILKMARASKALHAITDPHKRLEATYNDAGFRSGDPADTENVYFDLLKLISEYTDLRVVVDIIAGASAGGVNGVVLGRALAHDFDMESVTNAWLVEADVERLMTDRVKAGSWSKFYLSPLIHLGIRRYLKRLAPDQVMRDKLSMFLRSRWFKPPFDGMTLSNMYFTAIANMGNDLAGESSLLPAGQHLNVFLTVTDFYGHTQLLPLHDPSYVREREHRHVLAYDYVQWPSGGHISDFDDDHLPGLIFGARASSSFPGAFPPANLGEIDKLVVKKGRNWMGRERFIDRNFAPWHHMPNSLGKISFIDGSVLNNKPFAEAINAIAGRPAYREVDRRLVYIDPKPPIHPTSDENPDSPGFFEVIRGSLSDLPRSQPIRDDLAYVQGYNDRIARVKALIKSARPRIQAIVKTITNGHATTTSKTTLSSETALSSETLADWTRQAHDKATAEVGLFYDGYMELKLRSCIDYLQDLVSDLAKTRKVSKDDIAIRQTVMHWAQNQGFATITDQDHGARRIFLSRFDIGYRDRRLRFVIRGLNMLYSQLGGPGLEGVRPEDLDDLKKSLYDALGAIRDCQPGRYRNRVLEEQARLLLDEINQGGNESKSNGQALASTQKFMALLGEQLDLGKRTAGIEQVIAQSDLLKQRPTILAAVLTDYVGYPFWDVLTFSVSNWRNIGEYDEIRVDRISPEDCSGLRPGGAAACLKGIEFNSFGAFFSRAYRENDYIWGRLHAADRLIDIVASAAPEAKLTPEQLLDLKKQAFDAIVAREKPRLSAIPDEFQRLSAEIDAWYAASSPGNGPQA